MGGIYRSRRLVAPVGSATRPTSDKLRETLFNVLAARVPGARFADLYAGSGAVGLEALSRGAAFCCFAERSPAATGAIRANLTALQVPVTDYALETRGVARALQQSAGTGQPWTLIFLDPPYDAAEEYAAALSSLAENREALLAPGALIVAEHSRKLPLPSSVGTLNRTRVLEQGDAALSFFAAAE